MPFQLGLGDYTLLAEAAFHNWGVEFKQVGINWSGRVYQDPTELFYGTYPVF